MISRDIAHISGQECRAYIVGIPYVGAAFGNNNEQHVAVSTRCNLNQSHAFGIQCIPPAVYATGIETLCDISNAIPPAHGWPSALLQVHQLTSRSLPPLCEQLPDLTQSFSSALAGVHRCKHALEGGHLAITCLLNHLEACR